MRKFLNGALVLCAFGVAACDANEPVDVTALEPIPTPRLAQTVTTTPSMWKLPINSAGLGLTSDGAQSDGTYSVYDDGVCGTSSQIFTGGSGDGTLQTNNPTGKTRGCSGRAMTVVYPVGDPVYPNGGSETMLVFLNVHNISNATTTIQVGYANRVERQLGLNPTQKQRCDAWRWTNTSVPGDNVWVERINSTTYHVYTKDRDPDPAVAAANAANNKAVCMTTGQAHHLSVDLYVVSKQSLPVSSLQQPAFLKSTSAPIHQLTGGGKIDLTAFDLFPETYAFSASVDGGGNVRGQAEIRLSDPLVSFHAEVTCLAVSGNSAWVGGVVTQTSDPEVTPEGRQFWLRVQDNGDGDPSNPDRISSVRLGAQASVCSQQRPAGMPWVFYKGNLQVR